MADKLQVSLDLMIHAASKWYEAATSLAAAAAKRPTVEIGENQAGTFALTLEKYAPSPGYVADILLEGETVCRDIAAVLQAAHKAYAEENGRLADSLNRQRSEFDKQRETS